MVRDNDKGKEAASATLSEPTKERAKVRFSINYNDDPFDSAYPRKDRKDPSLKYANTRRGKIYQLRRSTFSDIEAAKDVKENFPTITNNAQAAKYRAYIQEVLKLTKYRGTYKSLYDDVTNRLKRFAKGWFDKDSEEVIPSYPVEL